MIAGCDYSNAKTVYHYTCSDPTTGAKTHNSLVGCSQALPTDSNVMEEVQADAKKVLGQPMTGELTCQIVASPIVNLEAMLAKQRQGIARGMARSCAPEYDANAAEISNNFTCTYTGTITDEKGRVGFSPTKVVSGRIFSCDMGLEITDELMEDIKLAAYMKAGGDEAKLDIDAFACNIFSIPH